MDWPSVKVCSLNFDLNMIHIEIFIHISMILCNYSVTLLLTVFVFVFVPLPGLRPDDEIVVLNGRGVSTLDLGLIQMLFSEQTLQLTLRREAPSSSPLTSGPSTPTPLPNQSQLLQDFLDTHHQAKFTTGEIVHTHTHTKTHTRAHTHNTVSLPKGW